MYRYSRIWKYQDLPPRVLWFVHDVASTWWLARDGTSIVVLAQIYNIVARDFDLAYIDLVDINRHVLKKR
jgi:hypothetical protein